tara:strand:+ start:193 stop:1221 length:1029 start_codon:yes stop_codon:yes gene_type:complete
MSSDKKVFLPLEEIGVNPTDENGPRAGTLNMEKMGPLRGSIAKNGLREPITVRAVTGQPHQWEIVHGHHRYRAMHDINGSDPTRFGKIPCYVGSYTTDNDMFEEQYQKNRHWDKICTPSAWEDLVHHILRQMNTGAFVSPYANSGLVWDPAVFQTAATMEAFKPELEEYIEEIEDFGKKDRKSVIEAVFAANGKANPMKIRVYTAAQAKAQLKAGVIPGFNGSSGNVDGGKLVYIMNASDYAKKPALVISKLIRLFDAANTTMASKPVKVIFVGHVDEVDDTKLQEARTKMTNFVKALNGFFTAQFGSNVAFSKLVDEVYFLPQKVNRTGGSNEAKAFKVTV